jgi:hypothetical protein
MYFNKSWMIIALLVGHACRVQGRKFQLHHSNGSRDTAEEVLSSPSKFSLIIDQLKLRLPCQ